VNQTIDCCAPFGQVVFLGNLHGTVTLDEEHYSSILRKELSLKGTWNSKATPKDRSEWDTVLSLIDRKIQVNPLISHEPDISNGSEIFGEIAKREIWYNKIVFSL
jgi:threonine dehydrogenase-like Zn-dependent dehydrogenase